MTAALDDVATSPPDDPEAAAALQRIRERLVRPMPSDRVLGWVAPLVITVVAGVLRFWHLTRGGIYDKPIFDETYYAHDSLSLLKHGVETSATFTTPAFIVHPPLAKWMIAVGEALFDHGRTRTVVSGTTKTLFPASAFSDRFSSAVVGTLAILVLARCARRLFRSTLWGCAAGLLLSLDGLEFVQSRVSLLDVFLMFWVLCAFACLVADRDDGRRRLAAQLTRPLQSWDHGPFLGLRPWRWAAGFCLGCAASSKWDGAFYVPALVLIALLWDAGARRTAGVRWSIGKAAVTDGFASLVPLVALPVVVYVASWTGWFLSDGRYAYDHDRYVRPGQSWLGHDLAVLGGWLRYQWEIWNFHNGLSWDRNPHPYLSRPWGWLLLSRPVAYYYESTGLHCGAASCSQEVLATGTPLLWFAAIPALVASAWRWWARRDWRAAGLLIVFAFGFLPWFREDGHHRVMFLFYMLPVVPFMVLAVVLCLQWVVGSRRAGDLRLAVGSAVSALLVAGVLANFAWLYPVLAGDVITYDQWHERMLYTTQCNKTTNEHHENTFCWI